MRSEPSLAVLTLVNLLVMLPITRVLMGLLLPAMQYSREVANRTPCGLKSKYMGPAGQDFEASHCQLPSAGRGGQWQKMSDVDPLGQGSGRWTYSLLMFLGQDSLYRLGGRRDQVGQCNRGLWRQILTAVVARDCSSPRCGQTFDFGGGCVPVATGRSS